MEEVIRLGFPFHVLCVIESFYLRFDTIFLLDRVILAGGRRNSPNFDAATNFLADLPHTSHFLPSSQPPI
jgi:hypothetical protein